MYGAFCLKVEVELIKLLLQPAFLEKIVDDAALGQIGLGDFDRSLCSILVVCNEVVFYLDIFFLGHLYHSTAKARSWRTL